MRPRAFNRWTLWLLPLLLARLCVPVGFMVSGTSSGLDVMLCPAYAALPAPSVANAAAAHVHGMGMDHSAHAMHGHAGVHASPQDSAQGPTEHGSTDHGLSQSLCPFAVAGGALLVAAISPSDYYLDLRDNVPLLRDDSEWISPPVLIDRIRGPPFA